MKSEDLFMLACNLTTEEIALLHDRLYTSKTLEQIGKKYGVGRERIRQKLNKAIGKVRRTVKRLEKENKQLNNIFKNHLIKNEVDFDSIKKEIAREELLEIYGNIPDRVDKVLNLKPSAKRILFLAEIYSIHQLNDEVINNLMHNRSRDCRLDTVQKIKEAYDEYKKEIQMKNNC